MRFRNLQEYMRYLELAKRLLDNLEELERKGEYRKASEVLWGAVVNYTKAFLALVCEDPEEVRSMSHRDLRKHMKIIVMSVGEDPHFVTVIEALHVNFYEDFMDSNDYLRYKERVLKYLNIVMNKIEQVLEQLQGTESVNT